MPEETVAPAVVDETVDTQETTEKAETKQERTFTRSEIAKMMAAEKSKWEAEQKEERAEAERMKKMNAEDRAQAEIKKRDARIAELEAKQQRIELEQEARHVLSEKGVFADESVLGLVVRGNADDTLAAINTFVEAVESAADAKVKDMLKGKTPSSMAKGTTAKSFAQMSVTERTNLFNTDRNLYEQLKNQS